jgi:membrane-bound serine protease (ClpP class)
VLRISDSRQHEIEMSALTRFLNVLVDPNVAMLLLMAGVLGLYVEFNQPGTIFPGVIGAICLLLGLVAMQILPFSWLGLLFLAAGLGLFVAEVFVTSYGLLFATGVLCFLLGGTMLFDMPEVSDLNVSFWSVLVPAVSGMALFAGLVVFAVGRSLGRPQTAGTGELIGMIGRAATDLDLGGTVFVRGEYWRVRSKERVAVDEPVVVVGVEGLELLVRPTSTES